MTKNKTIMLIISTLFLACAHQVEEPIDHDLSLPTEEENGKDEWSRQFFTEYPLQINITTPGVMRDELDTAVDILNHIAGCELLSMEYKHSTSINDINVVNIKVVDKLEENVLGTFVPTGNIILLYAKSDWRVYTHELGHFLGLHHVEDDSTIMFKYNNSSTEVTDSQALYLNALCDRKTQLDKT